MLRIAGFFEIHLGILSLGLVYTAARVIPAASGCTEECTKVNGFRKGRQHSHIVLYKTVGIC